MSIESKVAKTLAELGIENGDAIVSAFAEVNNAMQAERARAIASGAIDEPARLMAAKRLRDRWLARKSGILNAIDENWLKQAARDIKPAVGREFNRLRQAAAVMEMDELLAAIPLRASATPPAGGKNVAPVQVAWGGRARATDLTLPGNRRELGSLHPVTQVQREIEEIFLGLGFRIETGPEIESVYYNFDALNIPESHPSRDDWDTLYIDPQTVLRTHTSPVQIRAMEKYGAPLYIIIPGKCYRRDNPDSTHSPMFHQIEGLAVDAHISFADLKGTLDYFAKRFFGEKTRTRFSPTYFPFTEPSGQMDVSCFACGGKGCGVCKQGGWVEVMGCGMVHPEVLRHGGLDPDRVSGWAFGLGVDRFALAKFGINDIQLFFQNDVRFLEQF
jgi:phenylalanyl-tRNA synthetase alpha chain